MIVEVFNIVLHNPNLKINDQTNNGFNFFLSINMGANYLIFYPYLFTISPSSVLI